MATPSLHWLNPRLGGDKTLRSYGIGDADAEDPIATHAAFHDAVPASHIAFLKARPLTYIIGSYLFVHAGIRPGIALEDQSADDLVWIREPFLMDTTDHGYTVVHGHTPVEQIDIRPNRIDIDTGAVFGGDLSCLVLEGKSRARLTSEGPVPL